MKKLESTWEIILKSQDFSSSILNLYIPSGFLIFLIKSVIKRYEVKFGKSTSIDSIYNKKINPKEKEVSIGKVSNSRRTCYICKAGKWELECCKCKRKAHLFCVCVDEVKDDWECEYCL